MYCLCWVLFKNERHLQTKCVILWNNHSIPQCSCNWTTSVRTKPITAVIVLTFPLLSLQADVREAMAGNLGDYVPCIPLGVNVHRQFHNSPYFIARLLDIYLDCEILAYHNPVIVQNTQFNILQAVSKPCNNVRWGLLGNTNSYSIKFVAL